VPFFAHSGSAALALVQALNRARTLGVLGNDRSPPDACVASHARTSAACGLRTPHVGYSRSHYTGDCLGTTTETVTSDHLGNSGSGSEAEVAARLLERLLTDPEFRARFRRDPAGACREAGLDALAQEMSLLGAKAMHALDIRESKSSLAG
jgi:hypothetical protein